MLTIGVVVLGITDGPPATEFWRRRNQARLADAVYAVHVATRDSERLVVLAYGLLVRRVQQAVDLAVAVVVKLGLVDTELV
ncbi:MAG TPA: hypothetical protein VHW06_09005, partial [Streptosporangiaceae bacterium]|nr:hypothetical protein [Streptosporangiaceae bacterium]